MAEFPQELFEKKTLAQSAEKQNLGKCSIYGHIIYVYRYICNAWPRAFAKRIYAFHTIMYVDYYAYILSRVYVYVGF